MSLRHELKMKGVHEKDIPYHLRHYYDLCTYGADITIQQYIELL